MRRLILAALLLSAVAGGARAQESALVVENAWSRATAASARTGVAYATIRGGAVADRLLSASSPVAGRVELHETVKSGDVMKMQPVDALPVGAGAVVTLAPSGYHLMLMGLKHKLSQGESFPLTLVFEKAGTVVTTAKVQGPGATGMGMMDHGMHMAPAGAKPAP